MTWTKEKVLREANEGSYKWVQIKHQLNNASQALVVARNKKSMTVAFLEKCLCIYILLIDFEIRLTRTRTISFGGIVCKVTKRNKAVYPLRSCHLACAATHNTCNNSKPHKHFRMCS